MGEINLMDRYPRSKRPILARGKIKLSGKGRIKPDSSPFVTVEDTLIEHALLQAARKFGREYFDGDRLYGYGGYYYHPRFWSDTAKRFYDYYQLQPGASVLDVGAAKGFLLYDLKRLYPQLTVAGIDISEYAYENSPPEIKPFLKIGDARDLPYPDKSFDLVISINTVSNPPLDGCKQAIREIMRVSRGAAFMTVHAWESEKQKEDLANWNLTAQTCMHTAEWKALFAELGYSGDYYWSFA